MNDIINFKFYLTQEQLSQVSEKLDNILEIITTKKEKHPNISINIEVVLVDKENNSNSSLLLEALKRYVNSY